jgi:5-methylcytosine-specific restriction endonuclease McrA
MDENVRKHIALYGRIAIERQYCFNCRQFAFIIDGHMACCRKVVEGDATRLRRMVQAEQKRRRPSPYQRKQQIEKQEGKCLYCELDLDGYVFRNGRASRITIHWDHVVPYSYSQDNGASNFVAACHVCNGIKHDLIFQTLEEARAYVHLKRKEKGYM